MKIAVFTDFDGTISRRDVGYSIFHHFSGGRNDELLPDWKAGRLSTRDCLLAEAAMVKAEAREIYEFIDQFEIDPGFKEFVNQCDVNDVPMFVSSDGLDFYITRILARYDLSHLDVVANVGRPENGTISIEFPHTNHSCPSCGICKGERIQRFREKSKGEYKIIFVGDGYSDACATREADVIFAKKDLEEYCLHRKIPYFKYDTFFDVSRQLVDMGYLATITADKSTRK